MSPEHADAQREQFEAALSLAQDYAEQALTLRLGLGEEDYRQCREALSTVAKIAAQWRLTEREWVMLVMAYPKRRQPA